MEGRQNFMKNIRVYLLAFGTLLTGTSEMIVAGIVHIIAADLQISVALTGQLVTVFSLSFAIGTPIIVTMMAKVGRKKLILAALAVFVIGNFLSIWSPTISILLLSRIILGVSAGTFIVLATSLAAKLVPPERIGNAISIVSMGFGAALVLGVPLGITISQWLGWRMVFAFLSIFSLLLMIALYCFIPSLPGEKPIPMKQQFSIFKNQKIVSGLFIFLFLITGYGTVYTFLAPFLKDLVKMNTTGIGLAMFVFGILALIGTRSGGYSVDRWGTAKTILFSISINAIALLILPFSTAIMFITLLIASIWIGASNTTIPALQTYLIQQAPQSSELALSASSSFAQLGLAIGAGLGGLIVTFSGTVAYNPWIGAFIVSIGLMLAIMTFFIREKTVRKQPNSL